MEGGPPEVGLVACSAGLQCGAALWTGQVIRRVFCLPLVGKRQVIDAGWEDTGVPASIGITFTYTGAPQNLLASQQKWEVLALLE